MAKPGVVSKDTLIKCAEECLVENGVEKFTLRAVAEKAGVTQGTVYYHFKTKEQLILEIVQDVCELSWQEILDNTHKRMEFALDSAKSRCSHDSYFHKLFFLLIASGFSNEKIKDKLGEIVAAENHALSQGLNSLWEVSPIEGLSLDTMGVLINAMVDGLALQALLKKDFPVDETYDGLGKILEFLKNLK